MEMRYSSLAIASTAMANRHTDSSQVLRCKPREMRLVAPSRSGPVSHSNGSGGTLRSVRVQA